uniref:CBS domain containing protein n=1 Tax=Nitratidesulfovibrio vulgaris (strain DSM 19637 / Miyazaki F) TaxID=883 RepID=B8DJJ3_NITV9
MQQPPKIAAPVLITAHANADFDALAAMVAAGKLYPGAVLVFPGSQERTLRNFFIESATYMFNFRQARDIDPESVETLVIVDTRQHSRVPHVHNVLARAGVTVHLWDHHPDTGEDLPAAFSRVLPWGSTTAIIVAEIRERGLTLSGDEATMLGLGIFEDTGSFTFASTTEHDFSAAGWLKTQGMDLNAIAELIARDLTSEQVGILNALLESATTHDINGTLVTIAEASMETYMGDFALLAHKMMDMENIKVLFALCRMGDRVQVVARSRLAEVDVAQVCTSLGGGGHPYAASASVKDKTLQQVRDELFALLFSAINPQMQVRDLMSSPVVGVDDDRSIADAEETMTRYGLKAVPVFASGTRRCVGYLEQQTAARAIAHGLGHMGVTEYMHRRVQIVTPNEDLYKVMEIIVGQRQRLVPVVDRVPAPHLAGSYGVDRTPPPPVDGDEEAGDVVGVITRTDLINTLVEEPARIPETLLPESRREKNIRSLLQERLPDTHFRLLELAGRLGDRLDVPVYAVGGFVRDILLGRPNLDLDVVVEGDGIAFARALADELGGRMRAHYKFKTAVVIFPAWESEKARGGNGRPDAAPDAAQDVTLNVLPGIGISGTTATPPPLPVAGDASNEATAEAAHRAAARPEQRIDVATARLEYYEYPAALPTVELSSIKMDLYRRDFTINAQAVQLNGAHFGRLVDFFGAQRDMKDKVIRVLHSLSFVEDPTRILRAIRFEKRYDFRIGAQCERLIKNALQLGMMDRLSGARLFHELKLIFDEKAPLPCIRRMEDYDILRLIHPLLKLNPTKMDVLTELERVLHWYRLLYLSPAPEPWVLYLLGLCGNGKYLDVAAVTDRLAFSRKVRQDFLTLRENVREVHNLLNLWMQRDGSMSGLNSLLSPIAPEGILYLMARSKTEDARKHISYYLTRLRGETPDITGNDLLAMGIPAGPAYGRVLRRVLAAKLDGLARTRAAQLDLAHELLREETTREALAAATGPEEGDGIAPLARAAMADDGQDAEAACVAQGQGMVTGNRRHRQPGRRGLPNGQNGLDGQGEPDGQNRQDAGNGQEATGTVNDTGGTADTPGS